MLKKKKEGEEGEEGNPIETEAADFIFLQQQMQQTLV